MAVIFFFFEVKSGLGQIEKWCVADGQTCVANGSTIGVDNTAEKQVQVVGLNLPSTVQFTVVPTGTPCPGTQAGAGPPKLQLRGR